VGGLPAWSSAGSVSGTWAQRNLQGTLTASALSVTADAVMLRNSGLGVKVHEGVSSLTVDPATAGLNGRDQTAAFTASQDLYAYWISNGTTVRGVWADSAPPTGPDLTTLSAFAGYTYWCPIMVAKWTALSTFLPARVRGGWVHYDAAQSVLANGTQTAETTVGCSGAVPASASRFTLYYRHGPGASNFMLRVVSGSDYLPEIPLLDRDGGTVTVPNVSQQVFYAQSSGARVDLWVQGYECPNGA
jgi:hypothetical protein